MFDIPSVQDNSRECGLLWGGGTVFNLIRIKCCSFYVKCFMVKKGGNQCTISALVTRLFGSSASEQMVELLEMVSEVQVAIVKIYSPVY